MSDILSKWSEPAIRVLMMPRDTNAHGTIFGGVILSYIDQAGAIEARRQGLQFMVTVSMDNSGLRKNVSQRRGSSSPSSSTSAVADILRSDLNVASSR